MPLGGLFILGVFLSPQFRQIVGGLLVLAVVLVVLVVIVLIGRAIWRHRQNQSPPAKYVPPASHGAPATPVYLSARDVEKISGAGRGAESPLLEPAVTNRPNLLTSGWSLALLKEIEWHRFEHLVAAYEREIGNDAELTPFGADGGVDVIVYEAGGRTPERIIQCKAFGDALVGVERVRAFYGVMMLQKAPQGAFYTTSGFTDDALAIGRENEYLELLDGRTFLNRIERLNLSAQIRLFEVATEGDYRTPTCASCGVKMVLRTAGKGRGEGSQFWGCRNYPRCRSVLKMAGV